jgi:hypothetical protein
MVQLQISRQKFAAILQPALEWYTITGNRSESTSPREMVHRGLQAMENVYLPEEERSLSEEEQILEAVKALNETERAELAAIMWIGRGDYEGEDFEIAKQKALEKDLAPCYLAEKMPLAEYLVLGLSKVFLKAEPVLAEPEPVENEPDDER